MTNKPIKKKWHIKPRIFAMLLLMLAVVFSSVFFSFNLFIGNYIQSNVESQLDGLAGGFGRHDDRRADRPPDENFLPDLTGQPKSKIGARGEVFIVDSEYNIKELNPHESAEEQSRITSYLKEKKVSLINARYVFVRTEQSEYYISCVEDSGRPGSYLIFYVNVSGIYAF